MSDERLADPAVGIPVASASARHALSILTGRHVQNE